MFQRPLPIQLTEITTTDGVPLGGVFADAPRKRCAFIYLHGLSSAFYHGQPLMRELIPRCRRAGIGYFKFNNRGHDVVAKGNKRLIGVAFEDFKKCVLDIRAMIAFARRRGYTRVILAGHSTGANKIVYYQFRTNDPRVRGLILAGGVSDIAADWKHHGRAAVEQVLRQAKRLRQRRPRAMVALRRKMFSASRFVSLYGPAEAEDVFPVHDEHGRWTAMRNIRVPMAVIFGSKDEHMDRSAKQLITLYGRQSVRTKRFDGIVVQGADHGFHGKERELAQCMVKWMQATLPS